MDVDLTMLLVISARITPLFSGVGISPFSRIPVLVRLVLIVVFALGVSQIVPDIGLIERPLVMVLIGELFFGMMFLLVLQGAFAALLFWGRVVDMQIGFGAAAILNPATHSQDSLIGTAISMAAVTFMFVTGVHHLMLQFFVSSYQLFPLGAQHTYLTPMQLAAYFSAVFATAMVLFAPVMMIIWALDVMVGFLSKTMPQMNIYFVTLPLKITIGLAVLSAMVAYTGPLLSTLFGQMLTTMDSVR